MNIKQLNNKKEWKRGRTPRSSFNGMGTRCSYCDKEPGGKSKLKDCSRCAMASYCGRECQLAAYPEHKLWCRQAVRDFPIEDQEGRRRLLFSRSFGGAVSLLMKEGKRRYGPGLIHSSCSHAFTEYCGRRRTSDKRSITLTYVPEGDPLIQLQERALGENQPKREGNIPGWLETAIEWSEDFCNKLAEEDYRDQLNQVICVVAMEQDGVKFVHTCLFKTYFDPNHPAHYMFRHLIEERNLADSTLKLRLDWDWDASDRVSADFPFQLLYRTSVSADFYAKCSLAWQEKERTNDPSPFPQGKLVPPLGIEFQARRGSSDGKSDWSMVFGGSIGSVEFKSS